MNLNRATNPRDPAVRPGSRDAALLEKARAGDSQALGEIYSSTYQEVWRTVHSLIKNEDDALDALQDAYLKAFTKLDQVRDAESLRPWLRQIAANTARDSLRRKRPMLFSELAEEDGDGPDFELPDDRAEAMPEVQLDRKENQRLVNQMLDSLSDAQRLVVGMYYYQELSMKTIAKQLDLPQSTVKSQLRYAREKIEKQVRRLEKQGVKLYGAAPLAFFRALYRRSLGSETAPPALGRLEKKITVEGTKALRSGSASGTGIKAVTAKAIVAHRIGAVAAAAALVGGAAAGIMLLRNGTFRFGNVLPSEPEAILQQLPDTETPQVVETAGGSDADPSGEPSEPEAFIDQFADNGWKEGYLGFLAGTAKTEKDEGREDRTYWEVDSVPPLGKPGFVSENQPVWYLADTDHDNIPELCMHSQSDGGGLTAFSWGNEQINSGYVRIPRQSDFPYTEEDRLHSTSLYIDETTQLCYSTGPMTVYVEEHPAYYYPFDDGTARPPDVALPSYGVLKDAKSGEYEATCAYYVLYGEAPDYSQTTLARFTVNETGDTYYLLDLDYITEEEYLETERQWLEKAVWRCFDGTGAAQLQHIPGGDYVGPMTTSELAALLGGYDDRPEWAKAKAWLSDPSSIPEPSCASWYAEVMQDRETLLDELRHQYPAEALGAGDWQFAVWLSDTEAPYHRMWALYRQAPEEGSCCFLAAVAGEVPWEYLNLQFDRFLLAEHTEFYYDPSTYYKESEDPMESMEFRVLYRLETEAGSCSVLLNEIHDAVFDGEEPLQRINFASAEELTAALAEEPAVLAQGLGAPVSARELLQPDPTEAPLAWMTLYLEHPELTAMLDWNWLDLDLDWHQSPISRTLPQQWDWTAALIDGSDGRTLVMRGWKPSPEGGNWVFLTVSEDGTVACIRPQGEIGVRVEHLDDTSEDLPGKYPADIPADPAIPIPEQDAPMYLFTVECPIYEASGPDSVDATPVGSYDDLIVGWQADAAGSPAYVAFHFGLLDPEAIRAIEPLPFYPIPELERLLLTGDLP